MTAKMKALRLILVSAAAILAVACTQKELVDDTKEGTLVFTATFENNDVKSTITDGKWVWEEGDQVLVTDGTNKETVTLTAEDITENGAVAKIKTTTLHAGAEKYFAVTPPRKFKEIDFEENGAYIELSAAAWYYTEETKTVIAATTGSTFAFKNVFSLLKFDTKLAFHHATMTATNIGDNRALMHLCRFNPENGELIWGDYAQVNPTLRRGENESGPYYIEFVPHALPNGFTLTLYDENNAELAAFTRSEALTPVRGHIYNIANFDKRVGIEEDPQTATFTFANSKYGFENDKVVSSVTSDDNDNSDISIAFGQGANSYGNIPKYYNTGSGVRCYIDNTMTISGGLITKIVCTYSDTGYLGDPTTNPAGYTVDGAVGTWVGEANEVVFTYTKTCRLQKVEVTYKIDTREQQTLSFPQNEYVVDYGESFTAPTVSGAQTSVSYSSDNAKVATVDAASGAVTITGAGTAVITASAEGNDTYAPAKASYTLTVNAVVTGITRIRGIYDDTDVDFKANLTDAVITYVSGKYAFMEDASAGIAFYSSSAISGLSAGQKINGLISGTVTSYNGLVEIKDWDLSKATVTTGATIPVTTLTPEQLLASFDRYQSCRIRMQGVQVDAEASKIGDISAHTNNGITLQSFIAENVIVYPQYFNTTPQVTVWEAIEYRQTAVSGITLDPVELTIGIGETADIEATVAPADAFNKSITWESNNTSVVTVSDDGEVTGVAKGSATITATTVDGNFSATCAVTVTEATTTTKAIDFESASTAYTDWTFVNMTSQQTGTITAHGGTYYGTTGSKASASITTKAKVNPKSIKFYVSKTSTNTTASSWYVKVSSDGSSWQNVTEASAISMSKGNWNEVSANLSSYSDVYVQIAYAGSTAIRAIDDVALICNATGPVDASWSISPESVSVTAGSTADVTITTDYDGTLSVSSAASGTATATISGKTITVTGVAAGTTTLTVTGAQTTNFNAISKTINVTVTAASQGGSGKYVKVTSTSDLTNGTYLVVYETGSLAMDGSLSTLDAVSNSISVSISNGEIASNATVDASTFTFTASNGSFLGKGGKYFGNASDSNALTSSTTAMSNTVSIDTDGNAVIKASGGSYLRYNATSGQTRFRFFKSGTYTSQKAIQLYKYVAD